MTVLAPDDTPVFAVPDSALIPVSPHLAAMQPFEPNRMFFIRQSLDVYKQRNPGAPVFDASQGDGGASLPGTPAHILRRAAELQIEHGTAYDMPNGSEAYRRAVVEKYWRIDPGLGISPQNVLATSGGRDALQKAYMAMLHLGHRRQGDVIITSRVPWVCYTWGPYGIGANVIWAPGKAENGWAYSEDSIRETIAFTHHHNRKVAGLILTSPDNPTGHTYSVEEQARIARAALQAGAAYVIFDWMYHYVTDEQPMNLNTFLPLFSAQERQRLMFLDGITKSLGGSNIRNCHLIASEEVTRFLTVWSTHSTVPTFYSMAVAMAAYETGFEAVSRPLIEPVNASRNLLRAFLDQHDFEYVLGKGYYTFIHVKRWLQAKGWQESAPLGKYLAEEFGLAVVPGEFFSPYGREWLRFSYALPTEKTLAAAQRLLEGLSSLEA